MCPCEVRGERCPVLGEFGKSQRNPCVVILMDSLLVESRKAAVLGKRLERVSASP